MNTSKPQNIILHKIDFTSPSVTCPPVYRENVCRPQSQVRYQSIAMRCERINHAISGPGCVMIEPPTTACSRVNGIKMDEFPLPFSSIIIPITLGGARAYRSHYYADDDELKLFVNPSSQLVTTYIPPSQHESDTSASPIQSSLPYLSEISSTISFCKAKGMRTYVHVLNQQTNQSLPLFCCLSRPNFRQSFAKDVHTTRPPIGKDVINQCFTPNSNNGPALSCSPVDSSC